jgi:hypothetical protein
MTENHVVLIRLDDNDIRLVGPFESKHAALDWLRKHSRIIEDLREIEVHLLIPTTADMENTAQELLLIEVDKQVLGYDHIDDALQWLNKLIVALNERRDALNNDKRRNPLPLMPGR